MSLLDSVGGKMPRTMGFALIVAFLSLGAISGCDLGIDDDYDFLEPDRPDGGLDAVDPNAGIYPNIQVIQPFLSGAIDPIKVQYWDQTYYWGPDSDGNDACFKGTVGIEDSSSLAQETAPGPECPTSLGQVTPCNPAAAADTVASGAVQPAISGCERGGAACTDILVPGITDEVTCESTVRMADPIAAGAAWFQNIDAPGTKGGTASHWWYGTRADKTFDAEDGYGGTQIDYISDATNINIAASGGGSGPTTRVNNIYLCSNKDVVNPAESPDVCTLSSLFGSCGYAADGDPGACKINNIGLVDGAYNVFIRSATPREGFGGVEDTVAAVKGSDACNKNPANACCFTPSSLKKAGACATPETCAAAFADKLNACYNSVTEATIFTSPGTPSDAGVLVHGWDGTDDALKPWMPGNGQGGGARWSSSYINAYNVTYPTRDKGEIDSDAVGPTVSVYSVYQGGAVLSIPDTSVSCVFGSDAGTDSRPAESGFSAGCGSAPGQKTEQQWCGPLCNINQPKQTIQVDPAACGASPQCSINPKDIAAMLVYQRGIACQPADKKLTVPPYECLSSGWPNNQMAYNEVVIEPATDTPQKTISAYYNPTGRDYPSDPRVNSCVEDPYMYRPLRANGKDICCKVEPYSRKLKAPLECKAAPSSASIPPAPLVSACAQIKKWKNVSDATTPPPLLQFDPLNLTAPFSVGDCKTVHGIDDCGATTVVPAVCDSAVVSKFALDHPNYVLN